MFSVSQSTGYAILALTCLEGSPNQWVLARDIAACTDVPPSYLAKILHLLRELSPEGRAEVQEFLEFKLRKERQERRSLGARRSGENGS